MPELSPVMQQLANAARGGWDGIEDPEGLIADGQKQAEALARNARRGEAKLFRDTFETPAGRQVLAILRRTTIERAPTAIEMDERDPMAFALMQARRMGAANLIFKIEAEIAFAHDETKEDV